MYSFTVKSKVFQLLTYIREERPNERYRNSVKDLLLPVGQKDEKPHTAGLGDNAIPHIKIKITEIPLEKKSSMPQYRKLPCPPKLVTLSSSHSRFLNVTQRSRCVTFKKRLQGRLLVTGPVWQISRKKRVFNFSTTLLITRWLSIKRAKFWTISSLCPRVNRAYHNCIMNAVFGASNTCSALFCLNQANSIPD